MRNILISELRMTVRQRFYYSFLILWVSVLSLLFLLQRNAPSLNGYTNVTGTIVNIALYIIPLFMLIIGSFSISNEMENGQWKLLTTFPLNKMGYVIGKIGGQFIAQVIVFTFSFGLSLVIALVSGNGLSSEWILSIYIFSISLIFSFVTLGITVGCFVSTRWQALSTSVIIWFFLIMIWPTALIGVLGLVSYTWIAPIMRFALFINPAEFIRVSLITSLDGGSVFGRAYDSLVTFLNSMGGIYIYFLYFSGFIILNILISVLMLEWRVRR